MADEPAGTTALETPAAASVLQGAAVLEPPCSFIPAYLEDEAALVSLTLSSFLLLCLLLLLFPVLLIFLKGNIIIYFIY